MLYERDQDTARADRMLAVWRTLVLLLLALGIAATVAATLLGRDLPTADGVPFNVTAMGDDTG